MTTYEGSCGFEHEDGSYVLGALSAEDRAAFERHLPECDSCTRSVRELAGLPGLLARVPTEVLDPEHGGHRPEPVPATLLPALLNRVQRARRRRSWATAGLVAAAAAVAGVVVGISVDHSGSTGEPRVTVAAQAFTPVGAEPISGWVSLTRVGWGTRLDLTCSYADETDGYGAGRPVSYTMFVTRTDGTTEQVASWKAQPGRTMKLSAATSAAPAEIASIAVRTADGHDALRLVND